VKATQRDVHITSDTDYSIWTSLLMRLNMYREPYFANLWFDNVEWQNRRKSLKPSCKRLVTQVCYAMPSWQHTMVNMVKRWGRQVLCMQIRQPCIRTAIRSSPTFCNKEGVGIKGHEVTSLHNFSSRQFLTHCGRVTQICVFNTVNLGTSASSP